MKMEEMTVKQLREEAKKLGIKGRYEMTKPKLIEAINNHMVEENGMAIVANDNENMENQQQEEVVATSNSNDVKEENAITISDSEETSADSEFATCISRKRTQAEYIDNVEPGMIIAFCTEPNKAISAKVREIRFSSAATPSVEYVIAVSKNGFIYKVPRSAIIWVKTGLRWPKGVFEKLKNHGGSEENGGSENVAGNTSNDVNAETDNS